MVGVFQALQPGICCLWPKLLLRLWHLSLSESEGESLLSLLWTIVTITEVGMFAWLCSCSYLLALLLLTVSCYSCFWNGSHFFGPFSHPLQITPGLRPVFSWASPVAQLIPQLLLVIMSSLPLQRTWTEHLFLTHPQISLSLSFFCWWRYGLANSAVIVIPKKKRKKSNVLGQTVAKVSYHSLWRGEKMTSEQTEE